MTVWLNGNLLSLYYHHYFIFIVIAITTIIVIIDEDELAFSELLKDLLKTSFIEEVSLSSTNQLNKRTIGQKLNSLLIGTSHMV